MCFSAEASFGASAVITAIGVTTIKKAENKAQVAFAVIPLFFACQQFIEGVLWLNLSNPGNQSWTNLATYIFLVFAWIIWPVYIPLTMSLLEENKKRKIWERVFLIIGTIVSVILAYTLIFHNVNAEIAGSHIKYTMDFKLEYPFILGVFYFIPIVVSLFISSVNRMWYVGVMALISFIISALFYRDHFISVWCFFAAIISISVLWVVYGQKRSS